MPPFLVNRNIHQQNYALRRSAVEGETANSLDSTLGSKRHRKAAQPPALLQKSAFLVRIYYVNHAWKSVLAKLAIVLYMATIWTIVFKECNPWYELFFYLTLQGWTLELLYFCFSLYLDLLCRHYGGAQHVSDLSKAAAQAMSELIFATQVVIVLFFWVVVFPQETWRNVLWELNCHGVGLLLIVCDYLYRYTGFSLRNHRYIVGFAALYSSLHIFVVVYLKKQIYPGIDFKSVRSFVVFFSGLSTVVFTHKIFYLVSNWKWVKEDVKSLIGVSKVLLFRQDSVDTLIKEVAEISSELLSVSPRERHSASFTSSLVRANKTLYMACDED